MRKRVYPAVIEAVVDAVLSINGVRDAVLQRTLVVNAFDEPQLVKHARVIVQQRLAGKTYEEIAKDLDLTEYHMENCAKIVKLMEAAGLAEPYRRLTEKSDHVPQCCSKHWLKAGDHNGSGNHRLAGRTCLACTCRGC